MRALFLFLFACGSENELSGKGDADGSFDDGDDLPLDGDSGATTADTDSGELTAINDACADWDGAHAGGPLTVRDQCDAPPRAEPTWSLTPMWTNTEVVNAYGGLTSTANLTDDNGDGLVNDADDADVVYAPWYGDLAVLDGATGDVLWEAPSGGTEQGIPAIGDVDGDGYPEIALTSLMWTRLYNGQDGSLIWSGSGPTGTKTECGGPGLADLDGDGIAEVFHGRQIFDALTGEVIAEGRYGHGSGYTGESPSSIAADIDLDGDQEIIVGNAIYDIDGDSEWSTGGEDGFPAVANFDDDPEAEIISVGRLATALRDHDGEEIWSTANENNYQVSAPAIADFDGDGAPEVGYLIGGDAIVLDTDGTLLWRAEGEPVVWVGSVTAADLDDDGRFELLTGTRDGLTIYDGATGEVRTTYETGYMMCGANPVFSDLDGDGRGEIMLSGPNIGVTALTDDGGLAGASPRWNEGGYSITNIDADGRVPPEPEMNWLAGYNSFRAAPDAAGLIPGGNLMAQVVDMCTEACADGRLYVSVQLGNDGVSALEAGTGVELWGATGAEDVLLWTGTYGAELPSGMLSDAVVIAVEGAPTTLYDVGGVVDGDNVVSECAEDDNTDLWGEKVCG